MNTRTEAYKAFSGTFLDTWIDSTRHYEVYKVSAKVSITKEDLDICGQLMTESKVQRMKGTGSIGIYKVDSSNITDYFDPDDPEKRHEIVFAVDDPSAVGAERVRLTGVTFDEVNLGDYTAATNTKLDIPFTFTGYKLLQKVEATI
jgi:NADPH-dependent glutamate synthase beta subunit-like oxidoreductase